MLQLSFLFKRLRNNNVLFGGVIMSFAAWSAIFMTLIGAISGAIFGTISSRNKNKTINKKLIIKINTKK
ncbi:TPA: hypothetical protein ROY30_003920 [Bacillus cereus]|uniref:Uncharacterized protein n=1 Tax=Bacillus cereus TaxID=1396 RepID=A0A2A9A2F7_BACCE|nr:MULTISPECIES: hypothetical protein [Bacillus]MCP1180710.1 hypothetical protein [Bacillus sp. 1663tsa1]MCP1284301.1 hypothetical protein [Bacillus sp. S0635]MCQ6349402.1 hypothetical protein [Bacillus cereus]MCU5750722.1 hypothetical protein [Bacillus cereus]MDA1635949.1 hypothetical protein [Bacillus cereus]